MDPTHARSLYNDSGFPHAACQAVVQAGNGFDYGGSYLEGHEMTTVLTVSDVYLLHVWLMHNGSFTHMFGY